MGGSGSKGVKNQPPEDMRDPLLRALIRRDLKKTRSLLSSTAQSGNQVSNEYYSEGTWGAHDRMSPIHQALINMSDGKQHSKAAQKSLAGAGKEYHKWRDIVLTLLQNGANVNAKREKYDWRGCGVSESAFEMILPIVMATGDDELLALALQRGGDPNSKSESQVHSMRTSGQRVSYPIHTVASDLSYRCLKALIEAGADVNVEYTERYNNERGFNSHIIETALHRAIAARCDTEAEEKIRLQIVALLLESGADVNVKRKELVQEHLDVESPTDDPREEGFIPSVSCVPRTETALLMSLRLGLADVAHLLVINGADISATLHYGETEPQTVWDLAAGNNDLRSALQCKWAPQYHRLYPASLRQSIFTTLCIAKRQAWPLPAELLYYIFQWVATPSRDSSESDA